MRWSNFCLSTSRRLNGKSCRWSSTRSDLLYISRCSVLVNTNLFTRIRTARRFLGSLKLPRSAKRRSVRFVLLAFLRARSSGRWHLSLLHLTSRLLGSTARWLPSCARTMLTKRPSPNSSICTWTTCQLRPCCNCVESARRRRVTSRMYSVPMQVSAALTLAD